MMCRSRTVTTALERGRESQREGQREGGTCMAVVVGDESGKRNVRGFVMFVCVLSSKGTRISS